MQNDFKMLPHALQFQGKISYILWAEFNLLFFVVWLKGYLDLSSLLTIGAIGSLVAVKLRKFADESEEQGGEVSILSPDKLQECTDWVAETCNRLIGSLSDQKSVEFYLKFVGGVLVASWFLSWFTLCSALYLAGNCVFLYAFLRCVAKIDLLVIGRAQLKKVSNMWSALQIPQYKEAKKIK